MHGWSINYTDSYFVKDEREGTGYVKEISSLGLALILLTCFFLSFLIFCLSN